jgi:putative DNA primase/helicase
VIWSGEDDPNDTLIPRLTLSGAYLTRVYFISDVLEGKERRSFDPAKDMDPLRRKLAEIGGVSLLVVDPIVSAVAGDSHKNAEVRRALQPLADLAATIRCALLGITHFSKGTGGRDPVERLTGSLAFGALARIVMVAAKHQEEADDGRTVRLFLRAKSNIGPDNGGFEYDFHQGELKDYPGIFASAVLWGDAVEGAARDLLATAETISDESGGESVGAVAEWLHQLLTEEGGRADRRVVMQSAKAMGHKERTAHRARKKLGVIINQTGFGKDKRSLWTLPNFPNHAPIVPTMPNKFTGTHGTIEGTHDAGPDHPTSAMQKIHDLIEAEFEVVE